MTINIRGILKSPQGTPVQNTEIIFEQTRTSTEVLAGTKFSIITDQYGSYSTTIGIGVFQFKIRFQEETQYRTVASNIIVTPEMEGYDINEVVITQQTLEDIDYDLLQQVLDAKNITIQAAQQASTSQENASTSAQQAFGSAQQALSSETSAHTSQAEALASMQQSESAQAEALSSKNSAQASELLAIDKAQQASTSQQQSLQSKNQAQQSEQQSSQSAQSQQSSEQQAAQSQQQQASSQDTATINQGQQASSQASSATSQALASTKASDAQQSSVQAESSQTFATTEAQQASASQTSASGSQSTANYAASEASSSQTIAHKWAANPENSVVSGGLYSALHYAAKAAQAAQTASGQLIWRGGWSAQTGTTPPTPLGDTQDFYRITQAGTILGVVYDTGDYIHWDTINSIWFKMDGTDSVTSVNGRTGAIQLSKEDVGLDNLNNWQSSSQVDDPSTSTYATTAGVKLAYDLASTKLSADGTAVQATKLATKRTINGTDFDGTASITTASWGMQRTLTIGSTSKSIDGSEDLSWSVQELGVEPQGSVAAHQQQIQAHPISGVQGLQGILDTKYSPTNKPSASDVQADPAGTASQAISAHKQQPNEHDIQSITGLTLQLEGKLGSSETAQQANRLANPRAIGLTGDVSGSVEFDGTSNVSINASVEDNSHQHTIENVSGLQEALQQQGSSPVLSPVWVQLRTAMWNGYVAADGQTLPRALYPDAFAAIQAGLVPVCSDVDWLADPAKRGCFTLGDGSTTFRVPDYNGKSVGSFGAIFQRGDGLNSAGVAGEIQRDAIQNVIGSWQDAASTANGVSTTTGVVRAELLADGLGRSGGTVVNNYRYTIDLSREARTATETRSVNVTGCWGVKLFGAVQNVGSADAAALATAVAGLQSRVSVLEDRKSTCLVNATGTGAPHETTVAALPANITTNTRYVLPNPFGNNTPVQCIVEVKQQGKWFATGWIYAGSSAVYGVSAGYVQGEGIIVQTGKNYLCGGGVDSGGVGGQQAAATSLPCRVFVTRIDY